MVCDNVSCIRFIYLENSLNEIKGELDLLVVGLHAFMLELGFQNKVCRGVKLVCAKFFSATFEFKEIGRGNGFSKSSVEALRIERAQSARKFFSAPFHIGK